MKGEMDATQLVCDATFESNEAENEENDKHERNQPLAKLSILNNEHIPEAEFPLFMGENVMGRDPNTCNVPLPAASISKRHATICISAYRRRDRRSEVDIEALIWDLGSLNGTRKGRLKLTPKVRYALSDGDSLTIADIPCQYVSCAVDTVSLQEDVRTPVSRSPAVKARSPDTSGKNGVDRTTDSKKCVNGGTKAEVSVTQTPVRTRCLSFEETPTQPQGTLVPESDSDSDGEKGGVGERRHKALAVSDSDSHKSSPTCSTFLSPNNKIVPESEDESPITPSSKNRPYRHISPSKEETDAELAGQLLEEKKTIAMVDDSEEEERIGEERITPEGRKSEKSGHHMNVTQAKHVSLTKDEIPMSAPAACTDATPSFNMDSDTDVEGEGGEVASKGPVMLNPRQVSQPNTDKFHMDSDTDVDEDVDASDKAGKSAAAADDSTRPPGLVSCPVIQPEALAMDSDTDVDDDVAVSDAATKTKPTSGRSAPTADTAVSTQPKDFHLESDTDVDEEEEGECGTHKSNSNTDETPTRLDMKPNGSESSLAAPHSLHMDSDTDDEAIPAFTLGEPLLVSAGAAESCTPPHTVGDIPSDSDTDVEDESPRVIAVPGTTLAVFPGAASEALKSDSKVDTAAGGSSKPPDGDESNPADLRVDSDTDVEDNEADIDEADDDQIPNLTRQNTPGQLVPPLQKCSTPVQLSAGEVENMDTQAFLAPSLIPFGGMVEPAIGPVLSSCSESQDEEDFVVAETQSFVLQTRHCQSKPPEEHALDPTQAFGHDASAYENDERSSRGGSFQLGLSDSSFLQCQAQALAMENTQAFVSEERSLNLENTQTYVAISNADGISAEATQAFLVASEKESQADLASESTQAYISNPCNDSDSETDDEDNRKHIPAAGETQPSGLPISCTLAMAETQPMSACEEEEILATDRPVNSAQQNETEEREEHGDTAQPQQCPPNEVLSIAETQPMSTCAHEWSDVEDSFPGPQKRKAPPVQEEEEQTQPLSRSDSSVVESQATHAGDAETQPIATSVSKDTNDSETIPMIRKRKAKQLQFDDEETQTLTEEMTQTLTDSAFSAVATQPLDTGEDDEEVLFPVPRRRRAKPLNIEETQSLDSSEFSAAATQLMVSRDDEQSDEEDLMEQAKARKHDVRTQPLCADTQPMCVVEDKDEDESAVSGPCRREEPDLNEKRRGQLLISETSSKPKRQSRTQPEVGASGANVGKERGMRARLREEEVEEELAECSEPPKRQARGMSCTRGRRGKSKPSDIRHQEKGNVESDEQQEIQRPNRGEEQESTEAVRLGQGRAEKERMEQEENERSAQTQRETGKLEKERKEKEEKERLELEKAEREKKEKLVREENERKENVRKEQQEKQRLETEKRQLEDRLETERKEHQERKTLATEKETKELKEQQENKEDLKVPARGRRGARRTVADPCTTKQDSDVRTTDDVPARRTRSRSNSSNSISSEKSSSSVITPEARGRGRGRGAKRTSEPPQTASVMNRGRRRTVAAATAETESHEMAPLGVHSRSNSSTSLNSEISSCSVSQSRGRGGRQRGRARTTATEAPVSALSDPSSGAKPAARGRKSRKTEVSSNLGHREDDDEQADFQQAGTTRGQRRATAYLKESAAAYEDNQSAQVEGRASEEPLPSKTTDSTQKSVSEIVGKPAAAAVSDGDEAKGKRKGRKRELDTNTEENQPKDESPVQAKRRGRSSSAQAKKNAEQSGPQAELGEEESERIRLAVERRGRGRLSSVQKNESGASASSMKQLVKVEPSEQPQTPTSGVSRKRQARADSPSVAKTPRTSSSSPSAAGRPRVPSQAYKVLFTGVVDEAGQRVLARLGGSVAADVTDMNLLVTDKVRRTVKFLCAVAKGVPIVTPHWLEKSGKAGSFLSPNSFVVKDPEQEKKFSFCLQASLRTASSQPLLQGYEIHVTKSVQPEPVQMKDIIICSGATFLPKMPSSHKPQTVVISCGDDWALCGPAVSASIPVVTAEFILTGILHQKVDFQTHTLALPVTNLQPAGGRGRGRKKT